MSKKGTSSPALSTAQVAEMAGVHKDTLLRWMRQGVVPEPPRNRKGWRVFTPAQARKVAAYAITEKPPALVREVATARYTSPPTESLRRIDWDFINARTSYLTHALHPYPAKFIPQIPNALIQELSSVGDTVADIFCGSGTTLVEALLLKRNAVGVDANPLACLISQAKTQRLDAGDLVTLNQLRMRVVELASRLSLHKRGTLFEATTFKSNATKPISDAIQFWFEPFVIEELAEIRGWCTEMLTTAARTVALTAFSSIVVTVSKQDSDTRYVRREKQIESGETTRRFLQALDLSVRCVSEFGDLVDPAYKSRVLQADVLSAPDIGDVDLVVCSPPYPNAYSYHLYHMTRMLWLDMDQPRFKAEEIGSHRKYGRKGVNAPDEQTFRHEMDKVFVWLFKHLKPSGYACFVVGNSTIKGRSVDNADILTGAARGSGFREVDRIQRRLQDTKKTFNPAIGKIKTEAVLILQR